MAAVSKPVGGFDCELVTVNNKKRNNSICSICLRVLREPCKVECCGKNFCHSCIEGVESSKEPCPHCKAVEFTYSHNRDLEQRLYRRKVQCTHQQKGCDWTGELRALDSHLNEDPQPAKKLKGCVFVMVKCSHCFESHQRQHMKQPRNEECPKRPYTCEHCKVYKSTFEDVTSKHWPVCEYYPVDCPNKCGAVLQRQNLKSHEAKDCFLTVIDCDFHYAGCEVRLPRKDMREHYMFKVTDHLSKLATTQQQQIDRQQRELASYKQQIDRQQRELASYKQQIDRQQEELARYKQQIDGQQEELASHKQQIDRQQEELASQGRRWWWLPTRNKTDKK